MSNSQSFVFSSLKRMTVDNLIGRCKQYVEQYVSKKAASRLDDAYKASRFDEVKHILEVTLERIKTKIKVSEYQKAEKAVKDEFPDAKELFVSSDTNEGSHDDNMGTGSGMVAVIVIIVAILVAAIVGTVLYLKFKGRNIDVNNQTVGEVLSHGLKKGNSITYTDKDKDLMELIHELSVIYDNTDKYLNS